MVDEPPAHHGDRLEAAVRVLREAGHHVAVVHAPAVLPREVAADVAAREGRGRAEARVAGGVGVVVVGAEEKGVERLPGEAQRLDVTDEIGSRAFGPTRGRLGAAAGSGGDGRGDGPEGGSAVHGASL